MVCGQLSMNLLPINVYIPMRNLVFFSHGLWHDLLSDFERLTVNHPTAQLMVVYDFMFHIEESPCCILKVLGVPAYKEDHLLLKWTGIPWIRGC